MQLANQVIVLLRRMTEDVTGPFVSEELGQPFADGINFTLDSLISEKSQDIKVNNPKQYGFDA